MDAVLLTLYSHRLQSIAEEMGVTLCRSAYSSNIKERRDFSCAIFDAQGQAIAQAEHLPVHLGSMPMSVQAALQRLALQPGDSVIVNDPFAGGTHLPDITMIDPVFIDDRSSPDFFVANRAHHADVGGMTPGSMPLSQDIFQEGLRIPPLKWRKRGEVDRDVLTLICANVRTPIEREGDLWAQWAANQTGLRRMQQLCHKHGRSEVRQQAQALQDYSEKLLRRFLSSLPDTEAHFEDFLEDDGVGNENLKIQVKLRIQGDQLEVDFRGSAPQTQGSVNTIQAVTASAVLYVLCCLLDEQVPANSGILKPVTLMAPEGSLVNARYPSAVVGGNVETSQRLVDVLLGAFAQLWPQQVPAASCGSMNNLILGGQSPDGTAFAYYETLAGGMGASAQGAGLDGVHTHMTNTLNTPIEALEMSFPFRCHAYHLRPQTGGRGRFAGGCGLVRELEVLTDAQLTLLTERRRLRPYGLAGGEAGQCGRNLKISGENTELLPAKTSLPLVKGERVRIETPGGGGFGKAREDSAASPS